MAEVVDSIIAELIARDNGYTAKMREVVKVHEDVIRSGKLLAEVGNFTSGGGGGSLSYAERHKKAAKEVVDVEEQATAKITRTRKARTDASVAQDVKATASAKKAAKDQADTAIAEAQREAATTMRLRAVAERAAARSGVTPGSGRNLGGLVPREVTGQSAIPAAVLAGGAEKAEVAEVNHLLADQARLQSTINVLSGQDKQLVRDKLGDIRLENQLRRAGLGDAEIAIELDRRALLIEAERAAVATKKSKASTTKNAEQFARGAGLTAALGGGPALVGIAAAAGIAGAAQAIGDAIDFAKAIKIQAMELGIATEQLQVYRAAADRLGVSQEQLTTGLGQLSANLGKAKQGGEEQQKAFAALGIDITKAANAGQLLPTLIDRISSIPSEARRAAIETALFGEQGRRLDGLLSGGVEKVNGLADAMAKAGTVLSPTDVDTLTRAGTSLAIVKQQLEVDVARVVAGNADAIESLATSFGNLVTNIGNAIRNIQAFNNQQIKNLGGDASGIPTNSFARAIDAPVLALREKILGKFFAPQSAATGADTPKLTIGAVQAGAKNDALLNKLNAPKAPKGPKGKSADQLQNEADERTRRFNDLIGRLQDEQARSIQEQTQDEQERSRLDSLQIARDEQRAIDDLKLKAQQDIRKGADATITNARLAQAIEAQKAASGEAQQVISLRQTLEANNRARATAAQGFDVDDALLGFQQSLARTAAERRDIEIRLLDIARKRETLEAQAIIDRADNGDPSVSTVELNNAKGTLKSQDDRFAFQRKVIDRQNAGPLEGFRRSLDDPKTQVEQAVADRLQQVDEGITNAISDKLGVKDPLLKKLLQTFIEQNILAPIYDSLAKSQSGGGGVGGFFSSLIGTVGGLFGGGAGATLGGSSISNSLFQGLSKGNGVTGPGFASGGGLVIGGNPGVDQNQISINGRPVAKGGQGEVLAVLPNVAAANVQANQPTRGGDIKQYSITVRAENSVTPAGFAQGLAREILKEAGRMDETRQVDTLRAVPGQISRRQTLG